MVDRNAIERALLINVVRTRNWEILIMNNITVDYFTHNNKKLFEYIHGYTTKNEYPDVQIICYNYEITDEELQSYIQILDIQGLCDTLKNEYVKANLRYEVGKLNDYSDEMESSPLDYVNRIGDVYNSLKVLGYTDKTVGLFDNIEEVLRIDASDVISTGFDELDDILIGWKRGEELAVFVARTGQGKSWMGLKFALAAALQGERVGIYSGEMSVQQLQERILCCAKPSFTSSKEDALQFLNEKKPSIRVLTQKELRRKANINDIEEMIVRDKLNLVVIDQLSLMDDITSKPGTPLRQQYGNISNDLFALTTKYNCPIILLAQSNRAGANTEYGPQLDNIAESDAVAQNATRVISMRNDGGILLLQVIKNRYGQSGTSLKYDTDYGINKYRYIKESQSMFGSANTQTRRQIMKDRFGGKDPF